jgi:hypothetical protein
MQVLIQREAATGVYRTRIVAGVICHWASQVSGKSITSSDHPRVFNASSASFTTQ